jgi:hypothetical protein
VPDNRNFYIAINYTGIIQKRGAQMPVTLGSGLTLFLAGNAPFDPGKNWFKCPPGHFWLKVAAPEMGPPLFDPTKQLWEAYEHAPVPRNRSEAAKFARVYEINNPL